MVDPYRDRALSLIAQGADPRRASPAAEERFGVPRSIHAREAFAIGGVLGAVGGIVVSIALAAIGLVVFDLRPAPSGSVRIAAAVRGAVPDADALSSPDLVVRLTALQGPVTTSGSVGSQPGIDQVTDALASVPKENRAAALADFVRFIPLLHDSASLAVARAVSSLSPEELGALARDGHLASVLAWIAHLSSAQQDALLAIDLEPVLGNPDLFGLLQTLPTLDPLVAKALTGIRYWTYTQRQALILSLNGDDQRFKRLVAAFTYAAPSLTKLLNGRLVHCAFENKEACQ